MFERLARIGANCKEKKGSEKREVLLVSFSDFAHFVFAIIRKLVYLHVLRDDMFNRKRLVLFSSVNLDNSYCVESQAKTLPLVRV